MNLISLLSVLFCVYATRGTNNSTPIETNESRDEKKENSNCGGEFTGKLSILQSPQNPGQHSPKLDCYYFLKAPETCPVYYQLEFVKFNLHDSAGCVSDRLEIDGQDALCGVKIQSRTYFASNGTLQLRYKIDGDVYGSETGFKILVTRSDCEPEQTATEIVTTTQFETESSLLPFVPFNIPNHVGNPIHCCKKSYDSKRFLLTSPNFPYSLNMNTECAYVIHKAAPNICRIRLDFQFFWMGQTVQNNCPHGHLEIEGKYICGCNKELRLTTAFDASNLKVLTFKSAGINTTFQSGFVIEVIQDECPRKYYPDVLDSVITRSSNGEPRFDKIDWLGSPQVSIEKLQLLNERSEVSGGGNLYYTDEPRVVKTFYYFAEPDYNAYPMIQDVERTTYVDTESINSVVTSFDLYGCEKRNWNQLNLLFKRYGQNLQICKTTQINFEGASDERSDCLELDNLGGYFKSPGYPYYYPRNLNICYRFQKQPGYCGTRVFMVDFQLEYSRECEKDFVSWNNQQRYCGDDLNGRTLTFDLNNKGHQDLTFVTDSTYSCRGFYGVYQQIACQSNFPHNPERRPTATTPATIPSQPACDRIIREKSFRIEVSGDDRKCSFQIQKFSEGVCKINLYFEMFYLMCAVESLVVDGMMFCGHLSGRRVLLDFKENEMFKEINYRSTLEGRYGNLKFQITGEQITEDCPYPQVPVQRLVQLPLHAQIMPRSSRGHVEIDVGKKHHKLFIRLQDVREICGIISKNISEDMCGLLKKYHKATQCIPLDDEFLYSPYQTNTLKLVKNKTVLEVEYEEVECSAIKNS